MAARIEQAKFAGFAAYVSKPEARVQAYKEAFDRNHYRIYSLAFRVTDNEMAAEELMMSTFCRAFATSPDPDTETIDRALITEIRELMPVGLLSLECATCSEVIGLRRNTKRVDLEQAVAQLPITERMIFLLHDVEGYDHGRISRIIGLDERESVFGLHQARLRLRELLAAMA